MSETPTWLTIGLASIVPIITLVGFWMALSSRLTEAKLTADTAAQDAKDATDKLVLLTAAFNLHREQIARDYINRDTMREVEDRLTVAINRLGDRFDRYFERIVDK